MPQDVIVFFLQIKHQHSKDKDRKSNQGYHPKPLKLNYNLSFWLQHSSHFEQKQAQWPMTQEGFATDRKSMNARQNAYWQPNSFMLMSNMKAAFVLKEQQGDIESVERSVKFKTSWSEAFHPISETTAS